jgi:hypothetical protein
LFPAVVPALFCTQVRGIFLVLGNHNKKRGERRKRGKEEREKERREERGGETEN